MSKPRLMLYVNLILFIVFLLIAQFKIKTQNPIEKQNIFTIQSKIKFIENQLSNYRAIERMNQNIASSEERAKFKKMLLELHEYRSQELEMRLNTIHEKFNSYQKIHTMRLSEYGLKKLLN